MKYDFTPKGVCSRGIHVELDGDVIRSVKFDGGCNGNTQGVAALAVGMTVDEYVKRCKGIKCGFKNTSCPDQLALALEEALAEGGRTHVWCRNKKLYVQCLENAREAFAQAGAAHEQNTTEEAELLVTVPSVEERREVLTGAAGMIARGRSLFPFGYPTSCSVSQGESLGTRFRNNF